MKMIAFFNNKGGVGKTTSAINIAYNLALMGNRIFVVDCDGQGNSSRFFSDSDKPMVYVENCFTNSAVSPSNTKAKTRYENIDIAVSTEKMNDVLTTFEKFPKDTQKEMCEKFRTEWTRPWYAGTKYDYIIVDLPPTLNTLTKTMLSVCDVVFVPIELSAFAIQGVPNVTEVITNCGCRFGGCFVTKFDRECPADYQMLDMLRSNLGTKLLDTIIPSSKVIKNSLSYRITAAEYMEWTGAAEQYRQLTSEIISICNSFGTEKEN